MQFFNNTANLHKIVGLTISIRNKNIIHSSIIYIILCRKFLWLFEITTHLKNKRTQILQKHNIISKSTIYFVLLEKHKNKHNIKKDVLQHKSKHLFVLSFYVISPTNERDAFQ